MAPIKPNAFSMFMKEYIREEERLGRTFPNGFKDAQSDPKCIERWKSMNETEKGQYKAMAKNAAKHITLTKKTGRGEAIVDLERAEMKEQEFKDNMKEYITSIVANANEENALPQLQFYVIHINYFYSRQLDNNEVEYYPAEIAIAEFCLDVGVTRVYHEIINEKPVTGFTNAARERSALTHKIPTNAPYGKSDYKEIFGDICKFIEPGKKNGSFPPLYTMHTQEDVFCPTKSVLSRLAAASGMADDYFLLYSIEELFSTIRNAIIEQSSSTKMEPIVASLELKKDPFAYKIGLDCEFHSTLKAGSLHCSLSYVKRWLYVICAYCCDSLKISMIPGVHMPKENVDPSSLRSLNSSFCSLTLSESRRLNSTLSMTGVSNQYRERVSERTFKEELRRRAEANEKEIEIIDHSKINETFKKPQEPIERPLRAPFTRSAAFNVDSTDTESIDLSENSFPALNIGRGTVLKKKIQAKSSIGHGYADRLK